MKLVVTFLLQRSWESPILFLSARTTADSPETPETTEVQMAQVQTKTRKIAKTEAPVQSMKEMAQVEEREVHKGKTPSSFRIGKSLTPLRKDYRAGQMTAKDHGFLKDCQEFAGAAGKFKRLNADAGRIGRLFTLKFVEFEETGVYDQNQIVALTAKGKAFGKLTK
jgi:hypothetical protein